MATSESAGKAPAPNWALLAGLRFVLALIVALYHTAATVSDGTESYFRWAGPNGAVIAFLFISGFSVTASHTRQPSGFFWRRFWRITPMYVIGVIGGWLPFWIFGHDLAFDFGPGKVMPSYWILAAQLLSLQPILAPYVPFNAAMWTVGVEEVLYRLVPLLTKPRLAVLYALAAVSALYYVIAPQLICYSANPSAYGRLLWAFVLGSMLFSYSQNRVVRLVVLAGAPALLAFYERDAPTFSPLIAAIGGTAIIWSGRVAISPRMAAAFEYLGDLSYPLYVLHFPVAWIVCFMWILIPAPAVVGISLILSVVFLHAVDRPLRKLGRRPIKTVALNPYAEPSPTTA